ncbi:type II citrate synthase [Mangrovimicrobium sediminis]|uniref:Type II citrate synthase n=1 Tax=Mangrovimicrobium sediminis TaxID=2562682 RepID=A0A4Z0LZZ8_9GAMM|nr:type II citrate synthase [Haliea sp. SAOS-164]TGD72993.1 type II citrate synthase [Haliea sp. SAOS-164]
MPEVKREVRPIEVNYVCDACGQGMMSQSGAMDPQTGDIEHSCMICNHKQTFQWRPYPRIDHIGIDEKI